MDKLTGRSWGYRSDGKGGVESRLFEDIECETEEEQRFPPLPEGWVDNPGKVEPVEDTSDELEELRGRAEALGIEVDGRWGVQRLRGEIEATEAANTGMPDTE